MSIAFGCRFGLRIWILNVLKLLIYVLNTRFSLANCVSRDDELPSLQGDSWSLDPVCLCVLLAFSMPVKALKALIKANCTHLCDDCVFQDSVSIDAAIRSCRSKNALSVAINRCLLQVYAPYHFEVQCAMLASLQHRAACTLYVRTHLPGFLCALLYSADTRKRDIGTRLANDCALRGLYRVPGGANREVAMN